MHPSLVRCACCLRTPDERHCLYGPSQHARAALVAVGSNSVEMAMEWLLTHPQEEVAEPDSELAAAMSLSLTTDEGGGGGGDGGAGVMHDIRSVSLVWNEYSQAEQASANPLR